MARRHYTGNQLFWFVLLLLMLYSTCFIIFQHNREKDFKVDVLCLKLQDYNNQIAEAMMQESSNKELTLNHYINEHTTKFLRVTIIDTTGNVLYDNIRKDYTKIKNHANRKEFYLAKRKGFGVDTYRPSQTTGLKYFYCANYYPKQAIVVRSALPYNDELARQLTTDRHYIWFALIITIILAIVLYRFTHRLGKNITALRHFAMKAESREEIDPAELSSFPNDELGEISEHIVTLFTKLEKTRKEQITIKRQLTQNIAHELKTPVASIHGYLETILTSERINDEQKNIFLNRSFEQCKRLASLVDDLSTLNRLEDAPDLHHFQTFNVTEVVKNIEQEAALRLQNNSMRFYNFLPKELIINGNQNLIYSIFRNLTDNAITYAGADTTITLSYHNGVYTFADNGIGISEEHISRLFERFYRIDKGRSRKLGGTGLGLAIVKNAISLHGGKITVCNVYPHGLKFEFTLSPNIIEEEEQSS